jgi:hypothetical protein
MAYTVTLVAGNLEVEFTYDVDPGYRGDRIDPPEPASVQNLKAAIYGPKGQRLECPDWLAEMMAEQEGEDSLIMIAQEICDDRAYDVRIAEVEGPK